MKRSLLAIPLLVMIAASLLWLRLQYMMVLGVLGIAILVPAPLPWRIGWAIAAIAAAATLLPALVRRIHDVFAKMGAHVLDAPVSGGPHGARTGRLAIWVGGYRALYDQYKHVLDAIGDKPYYVGPIGTGAIASRPV